MSNFKFRFSLTKVSKSNIFTQKLSFQTKWIIDTTYNIIVIHTIRWRWFGNEVLFRWNSVFSVYFRGNIMVWRWSIRLWWRTVRLWRWRTVRLRRWTVRLRRWRAVRLRRWRAIWRMWRMAWWSAAAKSKCLFDLVEQWQTIVTIMTMIYNLMVMMIIRLTAECNLLVRRGWRWTIFYLQILHLWWSILMNWNTCFAIV